MDAKASMRESRNLKVDGSVLNPTSVIKKVANAEPGNSSEIKTPKTVDGRMSGILEDRLPSSQGIRDVNAETLMNSGLASQVGSHQQIINQQSQKSLDPQILHRTGLTNQNNEQKRWVVPLMEG